MPAELRLMQPAVVALGSQKLGMGAGFGNTGLVHHHDARSIADCRQPVSDDQRGTTLGKLRQRLLDGAFGFRV